MKTGILGGTFDPIHNAHIEIAKNALEQFELDKVFIMPTPVPPHKDKNKIASNFHRINMIKIAIEGLEGIEFSNFELNKNIVTYTADTLYMLKELHPENQYYFILGSDSIAGFMSWYRPDVIVKKATLLAARRSDESSKIMDEKIKEIEQEYNVEIGIISMDSMEISSSYIRTHSYSQIEGMVPPKVLEYIKENNLYQNNNVNVAWSVNKITEDLKTRLSKKRFAHTMGVAKTAKNMAEIFNVNPNLAYLAGLLHDCAKNMDNPQLLEYCKKHNIQITKDEELSPHLLHAKAGANIAKDRYGISDEEILSAITWHTTGKPAMTDLEKIIFSADYIEPGRNTQPNLDSLRKIAKSDLDLLVYSVLKDTLEYLESSKNKSIDKNTIEAYNFYKNVIDER